MKATTKYLLLSFSLLLLLAGAYILRDSVRTSGHYAEEGILFGALLSAFALVMMAWSIKLHLGMKAMQRHMRNR